jgi:hypothetical protein
MFAKLLEVLSVPIIILNMGASIIGGIWLAILGQWGLIGIGVFLLFTSHWYLSLLMIPSLPIAAIAAKLFEKKNPLGYIVGFISQVYTNLLIVGTCVMAFIICSRHYAGDIGIGYIPYLLWSWGMALGPWQFFASKEPDNEFSVIKLFSASVFYFLFLISIFIAPILVLIIIGLFVVVQLIVLPIYNMYLAKQMSY